MHMNNADGVPRGLVIISTNAGIRGTKAEVWRRNAVANPDRWCMKLWPTPAPWINPKDVAEAKTRDPVGAEFARLWQGRWISGRGGAVSDEDIDACFVLDGPLKQPETGWVYVAGIDLAVSDHHAGLVIVGVNRNENRMKIAYIEAWTPTLLNDQGKKEIDADKIERTCVELSKRFRIQWFGYDPAVGGSFMAQSLSRQGVPMRKWTFSNPSNLTAMAEAFVLSMKEHKLDCFDDAEGRLRRDFGKFDVEAKVPSGYRLRAVADEYGHADVGTALVICLPKACELLGGFEGMLQPDDVVAGVADEELTEDDWAEMDDETAELITMDDETEEDLAFRRAAKRGRLYDDFEYR